MHRASRASPRLVTCGRDRRGGARRRTRSADGDAAGGLQEACRPSGVPRGDGRRAGAVRRELRAGAARQGARGAGRALALHRSAAAQQGQVRRRRGRADPLGRLARRCSTRSRRAPTSSAWCSAASCRSTSASEAQKSGCAPRRAAGAGAGLRRACRRCAAKGSCASRPTSVAPRPFFDKLAQLAAAERLGTLSMGMSADFAEAIAAGATIVRVGTALFGARS